MVVWLSLDVVQVHFDPTTGAKRDDERRPSSEPLQFSVGPLQRSSIMSIDALTRRG